MEEILCHQSGNGAGAKPLGPDFAYHVVVYRYVKGKAVLLAAIPYESVTKYNAINPGALSLQDAFRAGAAMQRALKEADV